MKISEIRGLPEAIRALLAGDEAALRRALGDDERADPPETVAEIVAADEAAD
jgi:hypothetical protein